MAAQTAGWATPTTRDHKSGATDLTNSMVRKDGELRNDLLDYQAAMAGWATPRSEDAESAGMRHSREVADTLSAQVGQDVAGSPAATGKRGALNPALSLWLMGFPSDWLMAAPSKRPRGQAFSKGSGTRLSRRSRPSS